MADFNHFFVSGRLTSDAEIRATKTGKKLTMFSLANNDDYKAGEEWVKRTHFFNVIYSGEKQLFKGQYVDVEGKVTQFKYDKEGQARNYYKVVASKVVVPSDKQKKEEKPNSEYVTDSINDESMPF